MDKDCQFKKKVQFESNLKRTATPGQEGWRGQEVGGRKGRILRFQATPLFPPSCRKKKKKKKKRKMRKLESNRLESK